MNVTIKEISIRKILNSCGKSACEVEMVDSNGHRARASAPRAIQPGKREAPLSQLSVQELKNVVHEIKGKQFQDPSLFDRFLFTQILPCAGSDITLALSLSFWRLYAESINKTLVATIAECAKTTPRMPRPLVNVFSGGVHTRPQPNDFQQIMIAPDFASVEENIQVANEIYTFIEKKLNESGSLDGYSSSSGMLVSKLTLEEKLQVLHSAIQQLYSPDKVSVAIDAAAEHLYIHPNQYRLGSTIFSSQDLLKQYSALISAFRIQLLEDPFHPDDTHSYQQLYAATRNTCLIIGDDLFASNPQYIIPGVADAVLLKMNQVGTVLKTIEAAQRASELQLQLLVSQRSCETEDVSMCHLGTALGARYIKIGGPRRGDRIAKYNELLRLESALLVSCSPFHVESHSGLVVD